MSSPSPAGCDPSCSGVHHFDIPARSTHEAETGSTWDITGQATSGRLAGSWLEAVPQLETFWFARGSAGTDPGRIWFFST